MSTPYIGEIRMFAFGTRGAPTNWQACDGSLLPISEFDALYALLGTTYGGDGQTTFAVPDLRGRLPIHQGTGPGLGTYVLGQRAGTETVTLLNNQMATHNHIAIASTGPASTLTPDPALVPASVTGDNFYLTDTNGALPITMSEQSTGMTGGGQPHENCMPTLTVQFCIATFGVFPSPG